jgi:pimeloyl-ACP methyl ester carboxylesterase
MQLGDGTWINLSYRTTDLTIQLRANLDELGLYDVSERLSEIRIPTLVIAGAHDTTHPPRHAREIHAGIAGSEFLLLEHSGHGVGRGAAPEDAETDQNLHRATVQRFLARLTG